METILLIQHMLATIPPGEIFTTRQMLKFGARRKVDQVLFRLVREGKVRRLSYGVFCKPWNRAAVSPTVLDVADLKSKANEVQLLDKVPYVGINEGSDEVVFYTEGYSSSFMYLGQKVVMKKICGRKYKLSQSEIGRILLFLWLSGRRKVDADLVHDQIKSLTVHEKARLRSYFPWVPGWLHNYLIDELNQLGF